MYTRTRFGFRFGPVAGRVVLPLSGMKPRAGVPSFLADRRKLLARWTSSSSLGPTGQVDAIRRTVGSWPGAGTRSAFRPGVAGSGTVKSFSEARAWMVVTPARRRASFSTPVMYGK